MKIDDVAELLGKTRYEVEEMLRTSDVIELKLSERKSKYNENGNDLKIYDE